MTRAIIRGFSDTQCTRQFMAVAPVVTIVAGLSALTIAVLVLRSSGVYFIMGTLAFSQMF